jgi:hypothetical protein
MDDETSRCSEVKDEKTEGVNYGRKGFTHVAGKVRSVVAGSVLRG